MDVEMKPPTEAVPMQVPLPVPTTPALQQPPDLTAAGGQMQPGAAAPEPAPPVVVRRRAPIACRRCRRMRSKCLHEKAKPPCRACLDAGLGPADCVFPVRGQPDQDREYRHPRVRLDKNRKRDAATKVRRDVLDGGGPAPLRAATAISVMPGGLAAKPTDDWELLPPLPDIIEAVNKFTSQYFQLGFIPKQLFPERLRTQARSVSVFFLLGILSVSARLTPGLAERYGNGSGVKASEVFMERASTVAQTELYREPSLERCQGFYLLSIAQQGSGMRHKSSINLAIAMRMATLMQLHREETYALPNKTKELIIRAESARRTLWMLHSQDNLHSGPRSPVLLSASDITALLPSSEKDFAHAIEPKSRAALEDTVPAIDNPALISDEGRSLFAVLIQAHYFWGAISRRAMNNSKDLRPWDAASVYAQMERRLAEWERGLPHDHRWSSLLLKGYKQEGQDLAYLGVTMTTRLCNIVIRKAYLHEMISYDKSDPKLTAFWSNMALELFRNVNMLYEQIEAHHADRAPEEGPGAQMAAFCVYSCGFLACYPCKFPSICPDPSITRNAPMMVQRILSILAESRNVWPLASRWYDHLEKFYRTPNGVTLETEGSMVGMADSQEQIPHVLHVSSSTRPAIKPIQPRMSAPAPSAVATKEKNGIPPPPSPNLPILTLPEQPPSAVAAQALYAATDPSMRLPVPQAPAQGHHHLPMQQQQPQAHLTRQAPSATTTTTTTTTDGLGLLIEAFDTHHQTAAGSPAPAPPQPPPSAQGAVGMPYDSQPQQQHQQQQRAQQQPQPQTQQQHHQFYTHEALAMNDGYEHELGYYMSDGFGAGPQAMQTWYVGP